MRRPLAALAMLAALCCGCDRSGAAQYPNRPFVLNDTPAYATRRAQLSAGIPDIEALGKSTFEDNRMPSMVVALLADGHVLWWRGYGTQGLRQPQPVDMRTVYRIGSLTKVLTGMAVLQLRDAGKLSLDDPAEDYLPELAQVQYPTRDAPLITLRHMLTHTSGLPRLGRFDYAAKRERPVSEEEVLESCSGTRLEHPPGIHHEYSNLGFALLGLIVSRVSGMSYRQYASEHILVPLGMRSSFWDHRAATDAPLAVGYVKDGSRYRQEHHWLMGASEAMGGLYASLDDMVRLMAFQMTAWPPDGRADTAPLRNASLRESHMLAGLQPPGGGSGIAWGVTQLGGAGHLVFHTGATAQYAATMMFLPKHRVGMVAMTNCGFHAEAIDRMGSKMLRTVLRRVAPHRRSEPWQLPPLHERTLAFDAGVFDVHAQPTATHAQPTATRLTRIPRPY